MDLFSSIYPFTFCSFSSGSSGNSFFVGCGDEAILIDTGISASRIKKNLSEIDFSFSQIKGIFLTHDHVDHTKGLPVLQKMLQVPVYALPDCHEGIMKNPQTKNSNPSLFRAFDLQKKYTIAGMSIEAFKVPHDGNGAVGYHICCNDKKLTIVTDLGHINNTVSRYLNQSDSIVIEANYDEKMLNNGPYPLYLQKRIKSDFGHLENCVTADFLAKNYRSSIKHILFCHLSQANNTPEIVIKTVNQRFEECGINTNNTIIRPLPRLSRTELIYL